MSDHKFTNRLADEMSPYLLQHAHNPVDWHPWGDEAIERARVEDKPILLSIGYSACHWCHVMEGESFENEEIARLMNESFVNIKVDREERPDLDQIYMNAVQLMTGHGGWPLTVFLTPDLVPFFGGTYFPPEDRQGMPGFGRVLAGVADAYRSRPEDVREAAESILAELERLSEAGGADGENLSVEMLDAAYKKIVRGYDAVHGGFGSAPKFPPAATLEFLLRTYHRTGDREALEMVTHTCRRMAEGGMYDQLGGGFHRYSTDAKWLVPHFEKMLYDNALLARLYLHVFQATGENFFRRIAEETLDYVVREMTDECGGFYSAQDADSEGEEGRFFVWSLAEVEEALGTEDASIFARHYDVTPQGNFEGHNILHVAESIEETAQAMGEPVETVRQVLERGRQKLFERRERRIKPQRDDKILTSWNGLMLVAFAEASAILDRDDYRQIAERNADFVLHSLRQGDNLLHAFKDGRARFNGYLEDYAFFAAGLLTLYETSGQVRFLKASIEITDRLIAKFWDDEHGGFFFTADNHEQLIVRTKDYYDNATPSGNSVAAEVLLRLAVLTETDDYSRRAVAILGAIRQPLERYPSAFTYALGALDFHLGANEEIVIISRRADLEGEASRRLVHQAWRHYLPNKVVVQAAENEKGVEAFDVFERLPLLRDRTAIEGAPTAYLCVNRSCLMPTSSPKGLAQQLMKHSRASDS